MSVTLSREELAEVEELFPDLSEEGLVRLVTALDTSIDIVLDNYFGLNDNDSHG